MSSPLAYRPDIDGLRAVAVIGVLLFHADFGLPGGYVGVDVFFVISGFLITSLILRDLRNGTFSIFEFWERRIRRILPALAVVTAFTLIAGYFILLPADYRALGTGVISLVVFSSNIKFWLETSYFQPTADQKPLLHTWSLSVEEQFYLLIPLLLWMIFRLGKPHWVRAAIIAGGLVSLALSIYGSYRAPSPTFFLLPTRAWELAVGSLLSFARPIASYKLREAMGWLGLAAIILPFAFYSEHTRFPGLAATPPVAGAAVLIWSGMRNPIGFGVPAVQRILQTRALVWTGLLSYSLYLWHWPLLAFHHYLGIFEDSASIRATLLLASLILAWFSMRFVERPFRNRDLLTSRGAVFALCAAAIVALLVPSIWLWKSAGAPDRLSPRAQQFAASSDDSAFINEIGIRDIPENLVHFGAPAKAPSVFVWGDSHAMAILPGMDAACKSLGLSGTGATRSSTAPVLDWFKIAPFGLNANAPAYNSEVLKYLRTSSALQSIRVVVLVGRWTGYYDGSGQSELFRTALAATVGEIRKIGYDVMVLKDVPTWTTEVPKSLAYREMTGWSIFQPRISVASRDFMGQRETHLLNSLLPDGQTIQIIDPLPYLTGANGEILASDMGGALFRDRHHLSTHGALRLKPAFEEMLRTKVGEASEMR